MLVRRYHKEDCGEIIHLFYNTIHTINKKDYSESQLTAWAPSVDKIDYNQWHQSLLENFTIVVEKHNNIIGFGDIDRTGYLNRLFVHQSYQSNGIATSICDKLEKHAKNIGLSEVKTEASITAGTFFIARGYTVVKKQDIEREGEILTNYLMRKEL